MRVCSRVYDLFFHFCLCFRLCLSVSFRPPLSLSHSHSHGHAHMSMLADILGDAETVESLFLPVRKGFQTGVCVSVCVCVKDRFVHI